MQLISDEIHVYSMDMPNQRQLDSLLIKKRKIRPSDHSSHSYRDRGDSGGVLSSASESNTIESVSLLKADTTYEGHIKRSNNLKNKLHQKLTFLRSRNSFRPIRGDTDRLKSPEGSFYVHKIFGDGNCMYRSVSYIIWGDENEHRSLRTMVVEHITDNWWDYSAFVMAEWNISSRQEYYDYMIANGTYATELECVVATKLYHMNLSIYREIDETGNLERIFHNRVNRNYRTARLLFSGRTDSGHYDVLIAD